MDKSFLSISIEILKTYELKRRPRGFKHGSIEPGVMKRDWIELFTLAIVRMA